MGSGPRVLPAIAHIFPLLVLFCSAAVSRSVLLAVLHGIVPHLALFVALYRFLRFGRAVSPSRRRRGALALEHRQQRSLLLFCECGQLAGENPEVGRCPVGGLFCSALLGVLLVLGALLSEVLIFSRDTR